MSMILSSFASLLAAASLNGEEHSLRAADQAKLSYFLSSGTGDARSQKATCSFPSLQLKGHLQGHMNGQIQLADVAALNLASPMEYDRTTIDLVPRQILLNVSKSFRQLLISRLRNSMLILIDKMMKVGNHKSATVLKRLYSSEKLLKMTTVVTSFSVISEEVMVSKSGGGSTTQPILFETIIDVSMLGRIHTVTLKVPGTISASICASDGLLERVEVAFDTVSFLKVMMAKARLLVKETVKRAAKISSAYIHMKTNKKDQKDSSSSSSSSIAPQPSKAIEPSLPSRTPSTSVDDDLISSYPSHLRETVMQFLPTKTSIAEESIEGFPPQLAKTLKLLARSGGFETEDFVSSSEESSPVPGQPPLTEESPASALFGNSTWDGYFNKDSSRNFGANVCSDYSRPSKKRKSKVSFSLPNDGSV